MPALVDLYGAHGFDVLCVTDHVCNGRPTRESTRRSYRRRYLAEIEPARPSARASTTACSSFPASSSPTTTPIRLRPPTPLAVGLRSFVSVDGGIDVAIETAVQAGAALVAAHPFDDEPASSPGRLTQRFARDPELSARVHRFELFNRTQLFSWVAKAGLPCVASGDFHRLEHLGGWKSVVPCARDEEALVAHLRSRRPVFITEVGAETVAIAA